MSHPPGYEKVTSLNLPSNAPANITVDLISLIKSSAISFLFMYLESISILSLFLFTLQPRYFNICKVTCVSCMSGTLYILLFLPFSIVAAIIGRDAFLDPDIFTSPSNLCPPSII